MSGGEQQMLAIGRALMANPTLLLLDEPSMGIAPILVERIYETIAEINRQGTTILLVEQNANYALEVSNRAYVLETGTVALARQSASLRENPEVQKAYLGDDHMARPPGRQGAVPAAAAGSARHHRVVAVVPHGYGERVGLATGLLVTVAAIPIWLVIYIAIPRAGSRRKADGVIPKRRKAAEIDIDSRPTAWRQRSADRSASSRSGWANA